MEVLNIWKCPNKCDFGDMGLICGGDVPYFRHRAEHNEDELNLPNIYFWMNLKTGEFPKELFSELPFKLDDIDWELMFSHADDGCGGEPECPLCCGILIYKKEIK